MYSGRRISISLLRLFAVVVVASLSAPLSLAQQTFGGITGTVSDSSGGVIAGVTIKLVEEHTGLSRETKTGASGEYLFPDLPIGEYALTYTNQGFESSEAATYRSSGSAHRYAECAIEAGIYQHDN